MLTTDDSPAAAIDMSSSRHSAPAEDSPHPSDPPRILLVEDDATNAFFMQEMLESMGLPTPIHAHNGREALEILERLRVDMVFMDCRMPEMDGYQATRLWRERESLHPEHARLPILALTANVQAEDRAACLNAGMDDFLPKPVLEKDLRQKLLARFGARVGFLETNAPLSAPPLAPASDERPILNTEALGGLCEALGEESVHNLIQTFLDGLPGKFQELNQGVSQEQADTIHRIAHTLKSNCGILKAERMADVCQSISVLSDKRELKTIPQLHQRLQEEKTMLEQAIRQWIASRPSPSAP